MADAELLPNGDILVPVTDADGSASTALLKPGEDEHAEWLGLIQEDRRPRRSRWPWLAATVVLILLAVWNGGGLDEPLSHVGLNKNPCVKNAFGATFCGDAARSYCDNLADLRALSDKPTACDDLDNE